MKVKDKWCKGFPCRHAILVLIIKQHQLLAGNPDSEIVTGVSESVGDSFTK